MKIKFIPLLSLLLLVPALCFTAEGPTDLPAMPMPSPQAVYPKTSAEAIAPTKELTPAKECVPTKVATVTPTTPGQQEETTTSPEQPAKKTRSYDANNPNELDFEVENKTGKPIYVTCFDYQRKRDFGRWRWDKSPVYHLKPNDVVPINIDTVTDEQDRKSIYGYLGVFNDKKAADDAVYELIDDRNLLDLDQLIDLKGKRVVLEIEKYGSKGEFFEYDFVDKKSTTNRKSPELDFAVQNKTGKTILVTCFVYEKRGKGRWIAALEDKDDTSVWRFDKTPIIKLAPGQTSIIDVDTIIANRDREYVRGYLAIFDANEEMAAYESTYEQLESERKLNLGELARLKNRKIVIDVEKYGMLQDFIDYTIKPVSHIDFTKVP